MKRGRPAGIHTKWSRGRGFRKPEVAERVRALKVAGLSYGEIGRVFGFSHQRAQQYLAVKPKANGRPCENCGGLNRVSRHHTNYKTDEIEYLCTRCHLAAHGRTAGNTSVRLKTQVVLWARQLAEADSRSLPNFLETIISREWHAKKQTH